MWGCRGRNWWGAGRRQGSAGLHGCSVGLVMQRRPVGAVHRMKCMQYKSVRREYMGDQGVQVVMG